MKKCPKCNRTYADDGFTFCLEDGTLLSAPYDPEDEPLSTIQSGGPPPTAVMPADSGRTESETKPAPLPPTIASPAAGVVEPKAIVPPQLESDVSARKPSRLPYIIITSLAVVIVLGAVFALLAFMKNRQCPRAMVKCSESQNTVNCHIYDSRKPWLGIGQAPLPKGVVKVTWSTSVGKIESQEGGSVNIDTTGLSSGRYILVTATFTSNGWFCSNLANQLIILR